MSRPRQLAEVERIVARIGDDRDLTPTQRMTAQRDTWREQAYATGAALRRIYRYIATMTETFSAVTRRAELTYLLEQVVRPELVDLIDDPVALAAHHGVALDPRHLPGAQARPESTEDGSDG